MCDAVITDVRLQWPTCVAKFQVLAAAERRIYIVDGAPDMLTNMWCNVWCIWQLLGVVSTPVELVNQHDQHVVQFLKYFLQGQDLDGAPVEEEHVDQHPWPTRGCNVWCLTCQRLDGALVRVGHTKKCSIGWELEMYFKIKMISPPQMFCVFNQQHKETTKPKSWCEEIVQE